MTHGKMMVATAAPPPNESKEKTHYELFFTLLYSYEINISIIVMRPKLFTEQYNGNGSGPNKGLSLFMATEWKIFLIFFARASVHIFVILIVIFIIVILITSP